MAEVETMVEETRKMVVEAMEEGAKAGIPIIAVHIGVIQAIVMLIMMETQMA